MNTRPNFARIVRRIRIKLRITQGELAQMAGLYRTTISHFERGGQLLSTGTQLRLLAMLGQQRQAKLKEFSELSILQE